jgi:hypothetical protein
MEHLIAGLAASISGAMEGANTQYMEKVAEELKRRAELFEAKMHEEYEDKEADQIVEHFTEVMGDSMKMLTDTWEKVIPEEMKVKTPKKSPARSRKPGHTTAWLEYSKAMRTELKEENPEWDFADLGREVGKMWKELSDEDKEEWKEKAEDVNEENLTAPRCDWVFGKGKNKGTVCGCVATTIDDELVRCKKHVNSQKKRVKKAKAPVAIPEEIAGDESQEEEETTTTTRRIPLLGSRVGIAMPSTTLSATLGTLSDNEDTLIAPVQELGDESEEEEESQEEGEEEEEGDTLEAEPESDPVCEFVLKGGPNKGSPCGKNAVSDNRCKRHLGK